MLVLLVRQPCLSTTTKSPEPRSSSVVKLAEYVPYISPPPLPLQPLKNLPATLHTLILTARFSPRRYFQPAPWGHANSTSRPSTPSRMSLQAHLRSFSPTPKMSQTKTLAKSTSTPHLGRMAAFLTSPPPPSALSRSSETEGMNTIPDPRCPTPLSAVSRTGSTDSSAHPDLTEEVATLSTKLVNAINHQTSLDDTLQHTRHDLESTRAELETANARLAQLEAADREYREMIQKGWVVEKEVYDKMEKQLLSELEEEKKRRIEAERAKRKVDAEVETLTSALFEEANEVGTSFLGAPRVANRGVDGSVSPKSD